MNIEIVLKIHSRVAQPNLSAAPQISLCWWMLVSNPGLLRLLALAERRSNQFCKQFWHFLFSPLYTSNYMYSIRVFYIICLGNSSLVFCLSHVYKHLPPPSPCCQPKKGLSQGHYLATEAAPPVSTTRRIHAGTTHYTRATPDTLPFTYAVYRNVYIKIYG